MAAPRINPADSIVLNNGQMTQQFQLLINALSRAVLTIGSGSPEGVVDAEKSSLYMDEDGTTGSILYIKKLQDIGGDSKQGWILV